MSKSSITGHEMIVSCIDDRSKSFLPLDLVAGTSLKLCKVSSYGKLYHYLIVTLFLYIKLDYSQFKETYACKLFPISGLLIKLSAA